MFTTVVNLGGFTAAANALDLPRDNVSRRINRSEEALDITLFQNNPKITLNRLWKSLLR
ncbi:LysR family transcriptional regulator [Psychromonas sp. MB-3u-54]|uniref:LysR family transcriptional regulator n=1 Tax=Psychromonas sp. MB-3u-54 TaxID=2058319 RepID=UPI003FA6A29A